MQKTLLLITISGLVLFLPAFQSLDRFTTAFPEKAIAVSDTTKWVVPDAANELMNPTEPDEESLLDGKAIYNKHCRSCHGKLGDGTGSGGKELKTIPTDFTIAEFLNQTDGSMYWKIAEGRDEMKAFKKKLDEEDIWLVVNYIKTFPSK